MGRFSPLRALLRQPWLNAKTLRCLRNADFADSQPECLNTIFRKAGCVIRSRTIYRASCDDWVPLVCAFGPYVALITMMGVPSRILMRRSPTLPSKENSDEPANLRPTLRS